MFFMMQEAGDWLSWIIFFLLLLFLTEIQTYMLIYSITSFLDEVRVYDRLGQWYVVAIILNARRDLTEKATGTTPREKAASLKNDPEFKKMLEWTREVLDSFLITPVSLDPSGILQRLEHLLDIRKKRLRGIASRIVLDAPDYLKRNLESALEATSAIHTIYKLAEHIFRVGVNTKSYVYLMQLKMLIPFLREIVISYYDALKAFQAGIPIGDSVGPMVSQRFFSGEVEVDQVNDVAYSVSEFEGRYVLALKALGPGSEVGKPGEVIKRIIEELKGDVQAVITVDAALRLESEKTGTVAIGVGAAIGDPGPEKYKIEDVCTKYKIPLYAIVIKESYIEAVTPMNKEIAAAAEQAVNIVKKLIREEVSDEGKVIIAGIGNTVGIGNEGIEQKATSS